MTRSLINIELVGPVDDLDNIFLNGAMSALFPGTYSNVEGGIIRLIQDTKTVQQALPELKFYLDSNGFDIDTVSIRQLTPDMVFGGSR